MKKYFLFFGYLLSLCLHSQTVKVDYIFTVNIYKPFDFPATLYANYKGEKMFSVKYGIEEDEPSVGASGVSFTSKEKYDYLLYYSEKGEGLISDNINEKNYVLKDKIPKIDWEILKEFKEINKVKLTKAIGSFRGREYVIWFDSTAIVKTGPWKFNNLPGMIYEAYDSSGNYKWVMKNIDKTNETLTNPFNDFKGEFLQYTNYPKLKYGLSPELEADLKKNPYNTITEQKRTGLEIKFEWEK
ncbi:GLPGLI family protein [Chryseobacterium sp. C-71]|uniref:GLPGLI family protein n=1 Tax=Chryseobacterium sp. C-71 TaxID=2893882 RepID=UPI001E4D2A34|nr:GLPGLI family protein [Chryseobacterium sp. C-71]UFH31676.1 GLPGLI family protein [Chryseobacterium sp. C-71]